MQWLLHTTVFFPIDSHFFFLILVEQTFHSVYLVFRDGPGDRPSGDWIPGAHARSLPGDGSPDAAPGPRHLQTLPAPIPGYKPVQTGIFLFLSHKQQTTSFQR